MSQAVSTSGNTQHMVKYIDPTSSNDQLYLLLLASPFLFYTVLWFIPSLWVSMIGSAQPSDTMAQVAHVLKLVQGYVLYSLCKDHYLMPGQWIEELGQTTVICSVFLMVLGQYLNVSVYNALGTNGVYYGVRFGIDVPWCHDFPYNVSWLKHPQYVGSIMSIIAAIPLIQLPLTWCVVAFLPGVECLWTCPASGLAAGLASNPLALSFFFLPGLFTSLHGTCTCA